MINWVYQVLASLGYTHPIHAATVHIPIGNVVAAFVFGVIGLVFRKQMIGRAGYYALVLAFVSLLPGIFFAITDWLHYFAGAWIYEIKMKVALAAILVAILLIAVIAGRNDKGATLLGVVLSFLCFLVIIGLGYFGANLVYSGIPKFPAKQLEEGAHLFSVNCRFCHPGGGNIIRPGLPLLGSEQLSDLKIFSDYLRNPLLPGGKKGSMPAFTSSRISDEQMRALYDYITKVLEKGSTPKGSRGSEPARGKR